MSNNKQLTFILLLLGFFAIPLAAILIGGKHGYLWAPIVGIAIPIAYLLTDGE
jgi:hypothetical protein